MRAVIYRGPYRMGVANKGVPPIEDPNDAIVRVTPGGDLPALSRESQE
jgi:hypothetical protein